MFLDPTGEAAVAILPVLLRVAVAGYTGYNLAQLALEIMDHLNHPRSDGGCRLVCTETWAFICTTSLTHLAVSRIPGMKRAKELTPARLNQFMPAVSASISVVANELICNPGSEALCERVCGMDKC